MTLAEYPRKVAQGGFQRRLPLPEGNCFARTFAANVIGQVQREDARAVAARMWPNDRVVAEILERAATAPATTFTTGWAAELVQRLVSDAVSVLGPMSAGVQLLSQGLVLSFDHYGNISTPGFVAGAGNAGFVAEGDPIPVRQLAAVPGALLPHKLCDIVVLTREMIESSNAEALLGNALARSQGLALDAVLFDANPATAARPAGLRNGIAALTSSNASDMQTAVIEDIAALFSAAGTVGGPGPYVLIANPGRAMSMRIRMTRYGAEAEQLVVGFVIGTPAVGNDVLVVATQALVAAFSPAPQVETGKAAALHMSDAPQPIGSAAPARSLFQTDSIALKVRWPMTWSLRDPRGVAWLTPTWK
jgi:hypothetical protein